MGILPESVHEAAEKLSELHLSEIDRQSRIDPNRKVTLPRSGAVLNVLSQLNPEHMQTAMGIANELSEQALASK